MLKRIAALFMILPVLALTACGGDTSTSDMSGGASSTPPEESTAPSIDTDQETTQPEADIDLPKVEF